MFLYSYGCFVNIVLKNFGVNNEFFSIYSKHWFYRTFTYFRYYTAAFWGDQTPKTGKKYWGESKRI